MLGQIISHYKILEKLGAGGMGVVYKAQDLKLDRFVVLKFLSPDLTRDEKAKERFIVEAKAASALDHPNVCTIYEINETDDGKLFIAMAYYEGETLAAKIKQQKENSKASLDWAIDITVQIASGLARAHEAGIVHRDIKPANIIITKRKEVKILDFGLAKLAGQQHLAKSGATLGTIAYMSPEQAQGLEVDHRTDIGSLGVVMYEMLTGQLPFQGHYDQAVMYAIVNTELEPITKLRSEVPAELERLVQKALQKNPAHRYQKMEEVLANFKLAGAKVATKISPPEEKSRLAIVVLPFTDLSPQKDQEYFCDGLTEELIDALTKLEGCRMVSRTSAFAFKGKELDIRTIGKQLNVSHALEGSVRKAGNRLRITAQLTNVEDGFQLWSEKYDRELDDVFAIQDDIADAIVKKLKMKLTGAQQTVLVKRYTKNLEAYNLYLLARFHLNKRTEEGLQKGVAYCEQAIALEPGYALAYAGLADGYALLGFQGFIPPKEAMPKAKASAEQALTIDDELAEAHISLGCIRALYERNWPESAKAFQRALELHPNNSTAHYWHALWYLLPTGQFEQCLAEIKRALELDPLSLVLKAGIGWQYYFARQFEQAIAALQKTLEMDENFLFAHDLLGQAYLQKGMHEQAIAEMEKAVALSNRRTLSLSTLGHGYAISGKSAEAQKILKELLELAKSKYVSSYDIALVYAGLGENGQALAWLEKAFAEHNGWLVFLKVEPRLEPLRAEARFSVLLEKVGLRP